MKPIREIAEEVARRQFAKDELRVGDAIMYRDALDFACEVGTRVLAEAILDRPVVWGGDGRAD